MNPETSPEKEKGKESPKEYSKSKLSTVVENGAGVMSVVGTLFKVMTLVGIFF